MAADSLLFVGSGDALPNPDRSHACLLLQLEGQNILLDSGEPAARNLSVNGVNFNRIDAVVFSHLHPDHVGGFLQLIIAMWLVAKRKRDIPVYMPAEGIDTFQRLIHTTYLFRELIKFGPQFRPLTDRQSFPIGPVQITPYRTSHLDSIRRIGGNKHGIACEPFLIEAATKTKRVVYSGDMGAAKDLEPVLDRPLDLLASECAHFSPQSLFKLVQAKPVKCLAMTHLSRPIWQKRDQLPVLAGQYGLAEKLLLAHDGLRVEF